MKTPEETALALRNISDTLRELFPEAERTSMMNNPEGLTIALHGLTNYSAATESMRRLGIGEREKQSHDPQNPWGVLSGKMACGISVDAFHRGLAPSCKIITSFKSIPKTQTVDTGDTIQVPTMVIVCGGEA